MEGGDRFARLEPYGTDKLKIPLSEFPDSNPSGSPAKLIVVTAITPTPAGEGKSTTAVGLTQGLAKIGKKPVLTIRQPSLGPVFGHKGGGTGGGVDPGRIEGAALGTMRPPGTKTKVSAFSRLGSDSEFALKSRMS